MIAFLLSPIGRFLTVLLLLATLSFGVAWKIQGYRLDAAHAKYEQFVGETRAAGEAQNAAAKITDAANLKRKKDSDAENARAKRDLDAVYSAYGKLRDQRARGSLLPETPASAPGPPVATFDRSALDRALSDFDRGVEKLLREGDAARVDLDDARRWAQQ